MLEMASIYSPSFYLSEEVPANEQICSYLATVNRHLALKDKQLGHSASHAPKFEVSKLTFCIDSDDENESEVELQRERSITKVLGSGKFLPSADARIRHLLPSKV